MTRKFYDLEAEEREATRDDEINERLDDLHSSIEDIFAMVFSIAMALPQRGGPALEQ